MLGMRKNDGLKYVRVRGHQDLMTRKAQPLLHGGSALQHWGAGKPWASICWRQEESANEVGCSDVNQPWGLNLTRQAGIGLWKTFFKPPLSD